MLLGNNKQGAMMRISPIAKAVLLLAMLASVAACKKRDEEIGPAQKAGAAIDNTGDQVARELHDRLDKAEEAAKKMEDAARATGDKIEDATEDASKGLDKATRKVGERVERAGEKIQEAAQPK
jgi:hypothetical protein